ncbi:Zn-dependent oxidoreductase [Fretibacterium sp. OH1220_COT-178]|uniref:Zn-dependent oxidoreductase n=1 Tax=Fretibacterium sp. OH1220_COT-178 TaxID=2491047 RepID=UPI000F5F3586|nr:Zn-dependent oxidoreductase [Fretibacterium sp. OH1220_COT-178]RRD66166.1 Zn-dependent oxidoreductase [Fretibacterium sp. OH1220_COT-178]
MKAVYVEKPGNLKIVDLPIPKPEPGEVLVRVRAAGICGSDMHIYHGTNPLAKYPRIIGHEFAGEIAEPGTGVTGLAEGDRVSVDPVTSCGKCYPCTIGRPNVCSVLSVFGVHRDGGMAEYVRVPAENVHRIPDSWSWNKAAMVEPFSISANVMDRTECTKGDRVLILGAGPIGLTMLMGAVHLGAEVAVADVLDSRLDAARSLGAALTVNTKENDLEKAIADWTQGVGASVVIDAACVPELFASLLGMASPAGRVAHLGFSERPAQFLPLDITKKELTICGSRLSRRMFPRVIDWFSNGVDPEKLVSHTFPVERVEEAFRLIEERPLETSKVLLTF